MEEKLELERLGDIGKRLYFKLNSGAKPTKAVEEVAEENYFNDVKPSSIPSIWRYYIKLKNYLK